MTIFLIPICILSAYSILNTKERCFWIDYYHAISAHIKLHQAPASAITGKYKPVEYHNWEGWDIDSIRKAKVPVTHYETSNVPAIVSNIFHIIVPSKILEIIFAIIIVALLTFFYKNHSFTQNADIKIVAIFGFCIYMIADFLSPIPRAEDYKVQWLFPLLLISANYNSQLRSVYLFILAGLLIDAFYIPFLPMRHTIGEFIMLSAFLWLCITKEPKLAK
ncbi:MAG: hypothetical protein JST96_07385 [Bacteroidetes bacterium]|nr:hypothetical protein [Bacteroidota bacterium]